MRKTLDLVDQTTDLNGQNLYRISTLYNPPEYVKQASSDDINGPGEGLPTNCYADPVNRCFPGHTKSAAWMSMAFYLDNDKAKEASTKRRLDNFAEFHGIKKDVEQLEKLVKQSKTSTLADSDYALVITHVDGSTSRHMPVRNAAEVKEAAAYLKAYQDSVPMADRQTIARKVLEKAAEHSVCVDDSYLEKQAGYGTCSSEDISKLIQTRTRILADKGLKSDLEKTAESCLEDFDRDPEAMCKLACIVDEIDQANGLKTRYSEVFPRPEDVLFGLTVKVADSATSETCLMTNGSVYKVADFQKLHLTDIKDILGEEFASEVSAGDLFVSPTKFASLAFTLPRPDADVLDRLLKQSGISPLHKEASNDNRLDLDSLRKYASCRR